MPHAPFTPCTEMAPTGSSMRSVVLDEQRRDHDQHARDDADEHRRQDDTNAQGAVIATSPASMPLQVMVGSGLPKRDLHVQVRAEGARRPRRASCSSRRPRARVGARERRPGVEAEPAEREDERARPSTMRDVVSRDRRSPGRPVRTCRRAARASSRARAPSRRRSGAPPSCRRSPRGRGRARSSCRAARASRRPTPSSRRRVDDGRDHEAEEHERRELPALRQRAGRDRRRWCP